MTVEFGDAVSAIAASLVSARRTLDAATASLGQLYGADRNLRSLPVPSYTLAEATFDVPFVVEEVLAEGPLQLDLPRRPVVRVGQTEAASLLRGVDDQAQQRLNVLLDEYAVITDLYSRARKDPSVLESEPIPVLPRPGQSEMVMLKTGASRTAQEKLDRVLADFQEVRASLSGAAQTVQTSATPRLMVRLDAAALADASPERVHRVQLTFRDQATTTVDVDDASITLTE